MDLFAQEEPIEARRAYKFDNLKFILMGDDLGIFSTGNGLKMGMMGLNFHSNRQLLKRKRGIRSRRRYSGCKIDRFVRSWLKLKKERPRKLLQKKFKNSLSNQLFLLSILLWVGEK